MAAHHQEMCSPRVKALIVERLDLIVDAAWIVNDQPLVADSGLELDSVDTLELMIGVEMEFGATITDDETGVFGSVSRLVGASRPVPRSRSPPSRPDTTNL